MTPHTLDLTVLLVYLAALAGFGIYMSRRHTSSSEGYFLGGRKFTWFLIGSSLFATNFSTTQLMGEAGAAYRFGLAAANNDLIGAFFLGLSAIFFIPMYLRSRLYTIPEFLEKRFHPIAKVFYGSIYVIQGILSSPIGYYLGALAVLKLLGLGDEWLLVTCILIGVIVALFSVVGGLASVVYVETIQSVIMVGGSITVVVAGLIKVGGLAALQSHVGPTGETLGSTHFELLLPFGNKDMPWTAVMTGIALHSAFFGFCNISILQRALGAKDLRNAKLGMLFGAGLKLSAIFLFALPGVIAAKLYPSIGNPDEVYALMIRDLLPAGISALVVAGLLAALLSAAESGICAISSVIALNIYPTFFPKTTEKTSLLVGKLSGLGVIIFGVCAAPLVKNVDMAIYLLALKIGGFMMLPVGTCFLFGRFFRRINHQGAITTLIVGLITGAIYVVLTSYPPYKGVLPEFIVKANFYHVYPVLFLAYTALLFAVSYATPAPAPERLAVLDAKVEAHETAGDEHLPMWRTFTFWWVAFLAVLGALFLVY